MNHSRLLLLILGALLLAACASIPSAEVRHQHAAELAASQGWQALQLDTEAFRMRAFAPAEPGLHEQLTLYLEGDGFAWINFSLPSPDPTPLEPLALRLALAQPAGAAAYLARPCQYLGSDQPPCRQRYWTGARFAEEVVASLDQAADQLKARVGAQRLVLVGYSGGAALALLLAARRDDVAGVITVAGNLDHAAWTRHHRVQPLQGSLNPAILRPSLAELPQVHLVGSQDRVIPPTLVQDFVAGYPHGNSANIRVLPGYDHRCCWAENWAQLWRQNALP